MALTFHTILLEHRLPDAVTPLDGKYTVTIETPDKRLRDRDGDVVLSGRLVITTTDGTGTVDLPALPQDDIDPADAYYRIRFIGHGVDEKTRLFQLDSDTTFAALLEYQGTPAVTPSTLDQSIAARDAAASSATSAAASASTAGSAATAASGSASTASTAATTATTKAGEASTSATNAATSATSAATHDTSATTAATNAATSATAAGTAATNAATSATAAGTSASAAAGSATSASTSASNAATSAAAAIANVAAETTRATTTEAAIRAEHPVALSAALTDSTFDTLLAGLPSGASVQIPPNVTVTLNAAHTLTQPVTIGGEGTLLDGRASPGTGSPLLTIGPGASGTRITCKLAGSVAAGTYVSGHHAIQVAGTDNGAAVAPTYVTDLALKPKSISGFGSVGIYGEFVKDFVVEIDVIKQMGYGGVLLLSAINGDVQIHRLRDLSPGTSSNMYALQFTRRGASSDLVRYPNSRNCNGWVGEMHGVSVWDGLGTHGGQDITLGWGTMYNVKKPFDVVSATDAAGEPAYAPNNIVINQGAADSGVTDGTFGPAGTIAGAFKSTDVIGTPTEYAKGIVVNPGSVKGYGIQGGANDGAYYVHTTQGFVGAFGAVVEPSPYAVNLYHDNKDFFVSVVAQDPWTTDGTTAGVVRCSSDSNTGVVDFSGGTLGTKTATIVYSRGLNVKNVGTNVVRMGVACNFSAATTPTSGPVNIYLDAAVKLSTQLRAGAGLVGAPSYTFDADPASGIYQAATGEVTISATGTRVARFLSSALLLGEGYNLSIGTTTGTKIGTAATHKIGFYGKTPVVQPASTPAAATDLATALTLLNDIRTKLIALGLIA